MTNKERFKDKDGIQFTKADVVNIIQPMAISRWMEMQRKANDFYEENVSLLNGGKSEPPTDKLADGTEVLPLSKTYADILTDAEVEKNRTIKMLNDLNDVGQQRESAAVTKIWNEINS